MRYIDANRLKLPDGWSEKARKAREVVEKAEPDERGAAIDKRSDIWSDLKLSLAHLSQGKCWYCEIKQIRSDNPVDHFRPKNAVLENTKHPGYWWLAFEWKNYRFGCVYCNSRHVDHVGGTSGGKRTHFPLADEKRRAFDSAGSIEHEQPLLLDPADEFDPTLLYFGPDGAAEPAIAHDKNPWFHKRAKVSIDIYHFNHVDTKEARFAVGREVNDLVTQGSNYFSRIEQGDNHALVELKRVARSLRKMIGPDAEFSAAARNALMRYRDLDWVNQFVTTG